MDAEMPVNFDGSGLVPAVVRDVQTGRVLMLAYMNREALERTLASGETWFWSRSRQALWHKGETSGAIQKVQRVWFDCDGDALLIEVEQKGPGACHTGHYSCFYREVPFEGRAAGPADQPAPAAQVLEGLEQVIRDRRERPDPASYTTHLFREGLERILKKVGEEAVEVLLAGRGDAREHLVAETADLMYHLSVLLVERGLSWSDVLSELARRQGAPRRYRPEEGGAA